MKAIWLIAFLVANQLSYAQVKQKSNEVAEVNYAPLKIGEKVPDINLGEIVNYGNSLPKDKKSVKVSDFRGKLLILDFWTSTCGACIASFPKLEKLQKEFKEQLLILPVGFRREYRYRGGSTIWGDVAPLIAKWKGTAREMKLPSVSVFESEINPSKSHPFRQLFPFQGFPTIIWIDSNGIYRGTTEGTAMTSDNIREVLNGKPIFKPKKLVSSIDLSAFLIKQSNESNVTARGSVYSNQIDSLKGEFLKLDTSNKQFYHFYAVNYPLYSFYYTAYNKIPEAKSLKGLLIDSTVKSFYEHERVLNRSNYRQRDSIIANDTFCYEAILPRSNMSETDAWREVIRDLDKFSGQQSRIQKREVNCLKLIVKDREKNAAAFRPKLSLDEIYSADSNKKLVYKYGSIDQFLNQLNFSLSVSHDIPIIINETEYNGEIEIVFVEEDFKDMSKVISTLQKFGLDLIKGKAEIDVLIQTKTQ